MSSPSVHSTAQSVRGYVDVVGTEEAHQEQVPTRDTARSEQDGTSELEKLDDSQFSSEPIEPVLNTMSPVNRSRSPTPESFDPHRCCFCGSRNHRATRCTASMRPYVRRMIVKNFNLCRKCLRPGHTAFTCRYPGCALCTGNHHEVLCNYDTHYQSPRRRDERRRHDARNTYRQPRERFPSRDSSRDSIASSIPYSPYRRDRNYPYYSPRRNYSPSPVRRISRDRYYHHSPRREYSPYRGYRRVSDRPYDHGRRYRTPSTSPPRSVRFRNMPRDSLSPMRRRYHTYRNTIPNTTDDTDDERFNAYMSDDSFTLLSHPEHHQSLLMTVKGHIRNEETGTLQPVNIMLDSGAQTSFITKDAASRLSLQPEDTRPLTVVGFGGHKSSEESGIVTTKLIDKSNKPLPVKLRTREVLTKPLKPYHLSSEDRHTLRSYHIDPDSLSARRHVTPDILLASAQLSPVPPFFVDLLKLATQKPVTTSLPLPQQEDTITQFWDLDRLGITEDPDPSVDKDEDARILKRFQDTAQIIDGYLHVQFPWKTSHPKLADNKMLALKRLQSQFRSFQSKQHLWKEYANTINDYHDKGIIEEVDEYQFDDHRVYYIPHQAVIKETSATTKLRVVFDASSHYKGAPSLNDCLHSGPAILPDLVGILLRSRLSRYLLVADVEKAFLQIRLQQNQRDATRFLWLRNPYLPPTPDNIRIFRFTRVPFGITASPFLLAASIIYYLHQEPSKPLNKEIEKNTYVDNVLLGASSERKAIKKYHSSKTLFDSMHMNLREFLCNSDVVNDSIEPSDRVKNPSSAKLLGIPWNPQADTILIPFKTTSQDVYSKRTALSACSSTFDPLGLLTPFLAPFKIFIQDIWKKGYLWDEPFREEDHQQWQELVQHLKHPLPPLPRFIASSDAAATYELAVFGDASKRLFACCAYLICRTPESTTSQLVMAKSLLAPSKQQVTMPRLELLASLISVRLARFLHSHLHLKITTIHLFSDSLIALHWIHSTRPLKRFVQNRVNQIRTILTYFTSADIQTKFYYVQSEVNPADCATRGLSTKEGKNHIWWQGPPFLRKPPSEWPKAETEFALPPDMGLDAEYEFRASTVIPHQPYQSPFRFGATSSYLKLIRSTAYVLKFVKALFTRTGIRSKTLNLTTIIPSKDISAREIITAETLLITEHYKECATTLKRLPLDQLNAHRSSDGLIRCPNRLDNTRTSHQSSAPILLLPEHRLVHLLVMYYHKTHYHTGVHATIASLRSSYLIPHIKSTVTRILRLCTTCRKAQGHAYRYPEMPSLPPERVNRSRPFQNVGLDYLGPVYYRDQLHSQAKIWICLFTCMATRAVHLELVHNNTTYEFLLALRRFIARRGTPDLIISDNATTFTSGNDALQKIIYNKDTIKKLSAQFANRRITWKFNTPLSPWKGGFYERLVGLFKSAFKKAIHHTLLPLSQLHTLVAEIEAVLNSRPLLSVSDTSSSSLVLRPMDFISPQVELQLPPHQRNHPYFPPHRLSDWYAETLEVLNKFWDIWHKDYLSAIAQRHQQRIRQGRSTPLVPSVGDVVLVAEKNIPRGQWPLAIITSIRHSKTNVPRSVTVRMANGHELQRSVNQLYPLEVTAKEDPKPYDKPKPTRIQPPRAAKRVRFALGTKHR
ncbi:hypothetical protein Y032_0039g49 [Ancylostoma ceylanicum]|uniref:Integrase catalytic domain-containing protein n=1 Tax=Ancylostoma ceylanicum TaxID=53326 RepID=A0A016UIY4_9BILA|nr:hypothetical protein Y032_0039g49 [Ancylostoma ceylanicum]